MEQFSRAALKTESLKLSAAVFGKTVLAWLVSLMVAMSLSFVFTALGTEVTGYDIFDANGNFVKHVDMLDKDAVITSDTQTEVKLEEGQTYSSVRSELSPGIAFLRDALQTVMSLIVLLAVPCHAVWMRGDKDRNRVDFGRMKAMPHRGLIIGAVAAIPAALSYLLLIVGRFGLFGFDYITAFRLFHTPVLPLMRLFVPTAVTNVQLTVWQFLGLLPLTVLLIPACCALAYLIGFKRYPLFERLMYRNKKK